MVAIPQPVDLFAEIAGKDIHMSHISGPTGARGSNSDNRLILEKLDWAPAQTLKDGLARTYEWIDRQVCRNTK